MCSSDLARDTEADLVLGFEAGADDYVAKPFSMRELISRVRAIVRRRELDARSDSHVLRAGEIEIDAFKHEARIGDREVALTPIEFRLLALLASEDRPFGRRELLAAAWDTTFIPDERSCDVHVANLRRKIEPDPASPTLVVTVRGMGYRLVRS